MWLVDVTNKVNVIYFFQSTVLSGPFPPHHSISSLGPATLFVGYQINQLFFDSFLEESCFFCFLFCFFYVNSCIFALKCFSLMLQGAEKNNYLNTTNLK